jgi:predicted transcriptional regulator
MDNTCYVEKRHYDALFAAFSNAKAENANLKKAWSDLKTKTAQFDDRVLDDIHRFNSLAEENAYLIGSFNTMLAIKYDMEELEEKFNAENRK